MTFPKFLIRFLCLTSLIVADGSVSIDDVNQYMEDSMAQFKLQLHKASQQSKRRVKRTLTLDDFMKAAPTGTLLR